MTTQEIVNQIFKDIIDNELLEDRREYDVSDLEVSYGIEKFHAELLYARIQNGF